MKIEPLKKKPNAEDSSEDGEPMNDEYSIFKITELPDDKRILESLLYVQEDESDVVWGLEQKIDDPTEIILDKICDEIFGDG